MNSTETKGVSLLTDTPDGLSIARIDRRVENYWGASLLNANFCCCGSYPANMQCFAQPWGKLQVVTVKAFH